VKRLLAIAAILCLAQPVQANPHLAVKFAQICAQVAVQHPQETELTIALFQYQLTASPEWLCAVVGRTICSENPQLHSLLDDVLPEVEATLRDLSSRHPQKQFICTAALNEIKNYKNSLAVSLGASPVSSPISGTPVGSLRKRTFNQVQGSTKRSRN